MMMVIMQSTVFTALNLCECVCVCYVVAPKTIISPVFACARSFDRVFPSLPALPVLLLPNRGQLCVALLES